MYANKYTIFTIAVNLQIDLEKYESLWYSFLKTKKFDMDVECQQKIAKMYYRIRKVIEEELILLGEEHPYLEDSKSETLNTVICKASAIIDELQLSKNNFYYPTDKESLKLFKR